ncbi:MAG TPA: choice-of-anchor Q domain-containing protein [Solirubrobacterales bacterium]|nr:choice-of-anchor Q domain-containing protein [Solirubrobacterales bacterium]
MRRPTVLFLLALCVACAAPGTAVADPYPVTNTDNSGEGSLRAAIVAANTHDGADTIPINATGTIELQSALQVIFSPVAIVGPGAAQLEVRRAAAAPDFSVFAFTTDAGPSSLSGLTISNGRAALIGEFALGGGVRNAEGGLTLTGVVVRDNEAAIDGGTDVRAEGGGVFSEGPLTLRETIVADNAARADDGTALTAAFGGGVAALDVLTVEGSTISGNIAEASGDGTVTTAQGGGLLAGTEATVSRSTISGNAVDAEGGAPQIRAQGGGIQTYEATLTSSTLAGNSAASAGLALGANLESVLSTSVRNTIVAEPLGEAESCDEAGGTNAISSGGFNLDEDGSCEFEQGTDLAGIVAGLEPLAANGGPTPTHALRADSPALDRGDSFGSTVDQRGLARPVDLTTRSNSEGGDGADVGAFELQALPGGDKPAPTPILVAATAGDRTPPNTRIVSGPPRVTFGQLATFRFNSTESQSRFQCKIDGRRWRGCRSPLRWKVSAGRKHVFKVRAIDRFGNVDLSPARFGWRVKALS